MGVQRYLRVGAMLLLAATAWFSYQVVMSSSHRMLTRFVVELSQNLYFVGVVLTYLLWGAIMKLRETRTRLIQLVLALGVYFSAFAASYALRNLYPQLAIWRYVSHLMALWLPLAWSYTFLKVPEEARLATARLAAPNR
jgi:MFS family permease